jgi:hypothetical protein
MLKAREAAQTVLRAAAPKEIALLAWRVFLAGQTRIGMVNDLAILHLPVVLRSV